MSGKCFLAVFLVGIGAMLLADTPPLQPYYPVVISGKSDQPRHVGRVYAKSIPASDSTGTKARTVIYRVTEHADQIVHTFPWYDPQMQLSLVKDAVCVYQSEARRAGDRARSNHVAFTLYHNGRALRQFSTLELCGSATNVSPSVSSYGWISEVPGFRYVLLPNEPTYRYVFAIKHVDGRTLCFDPILGNRLPDALSMLR